MKVLLDECVPRKLRKEIANHEVRTVTESGWSGVKNGELLALAEAEFDVFLTVNQNLIFQQNLQRFNIGIILMAARNNRFKTMLPLMPEVNERLKRLNQASWLASAKADESLDATGAACFPNMIVGRCA